MAPSRSRFWLFVTLFVAGAAIAQEPSPPVGASATPLETPGSPAAPIDVAPPPPIDVVPPPAPIDVAPPAPIDDAPPAPIDVAPLLIVPPIDGPPTDTTPSVEAPPIEPVPTLPESYAKGWRWKEAGPRTVVAISDVAIHPIRPDIWAAATGDGGVWVTLDEGRTWLEVLGPSSTIGSGDEAILTEVEARVGELSTAFEMPEETTFEDGGTLSVEEFEEAIETAADDARTAVQQVVDEIQSELEAGAAWYLDPRGTPRGRPRVWFTAEGLLIVGRGDGLRVSEDLGGGFATVFEDPVTSFAQTPWGFVAGTPTGLVTSSGLRVWRPVSVFDGIGTLDLVWDDGLYLASTSGLWFSADLEVFRSLRAWSDEVWTTRPVAAPDGDRQPRALVLGANDTVWRAGRPVEDPANPAFGGPVPSSSTIVRRDDALLLAASSAGPFQSVDGGTTWEPIGGSLDSVDCRDVEVAGELVLLANTGGLYRLVPLPPSAENEPVAFAEWAPLGALIHASTSRSELTARVGKRAVAALVPALTVEFQHNRLIQDDWDADTWTLRNVDRWWQFHTVLTWRPNRQQSSSGSFDAASFGDVSLLVIGDEFVLDDGTGANVLLSKVNRGSTSYRTELADTIGKLYLNRQRLVLEAGLAKDESVLEATMRLLRVAELEARLDALTDGAVSDWDPGTSGGL